MFAFTHLAPVFLSMTSKSYDDNKCVYYDTVYFAALESLSYNVKVDTHNVTCCGTVCNRILANFYVASGTVSKSGANYATLKIAEAIFFPCFMIDLRIQPS